jgi:hypothetical protein
MAEPTNTTISSKPEARPAWVVGATICDCGNVAVHVAEIAAMVHPESWDVVFDPKNEVLMSGPDWRPLVEPAATKLARRSGKRIDACCTHVHAATQEREIFSEAVTIMERLQMT